MEYGSVTDIIHAKYTFGLPELAIAMLLRDVLLALDYLHGNDVIHRALRASHILVSATGERFVEMRNFFYITGAKLSGLRYAASRLTRSVNQARHRVPLHELTPQMKVDTLCFYRNTSRFCRVAFYG